jgi:hypothetical protein
VTGRIAWLSRTALQMAARAGPSEPAALAQWLYRFGSLPRTPAAERDFGPDDEPLAVLGLAVGAWVRRRLEAAYEAHTLQGWVSFSRVGLPIQVSAACKLYVSPQPQALPDAFAPIVDALVQAGVRSFKVGRGLEGLLRPDKLIAYFDAPDQMTAVVQVLLRQLDGCPAQGVPFTAELGANGLVSTGVDPPPSEVLSSWRAWITARLATSLLSQQRRSPLQTVSAVLAELRAGGVDTERWLPGPGAFIASSPMPVAAVARGVRGRTRSTSVQP